MTLRLEPDDPGVWALTLEALADTRGRRTALVIRCARCHHRIGVAGPTRHGPLFASTGWDTNEPLDDGPLTVLSDDGAPLTGPERDAAIAGLPEWAHPLGEPTRRATRRASLALLALPPQMTQDYPDLVVRCHDHGDAVVCRTDVLEWLRTGRNRITVTCAFPHVDYDTHANEVPADSDAAHGPRMPRRR